MQSLVHRIKSGMKPLEDWREDLEDLVKQLQSEGKLQDTVLPTLIARTLPIIHYIEFWTIIITCYYLPALRREDNEDRAFRNLLLPTASRCGLDWIEDIAVRLDGVQATVSALTEAPVIFAPPQHSVSLLDMFASLTDAWHFAGLTGWHLS